ncbi:MAG: crossover junction endodeoxyribonuclease RuvC [Duodenibacillus sp.]|nr:crossover junction endodeoxyribonuclease RuvC [Duodenibacillus sp.]
MRILGIDPGLCRTGWGVIDAAGDDLRFVASGCIRVPADGGLPARLGRIHEELAAVIARERPQTAAMEIVFLNVNPRTTLLLGQARGAAMACAAVHGLAVHEYAASVIKQSVVGTGAAEKRQVQEMMRRLLGLEGELQADAADALACAVTCAHALKVEAIGALGGGPGAALGAVRAGRLRRSGRRAWERFAQGRDS